LISAYIEYLVPPSCPHFGEFKGYYQGLEGLTTSGEVCASFNRVRKIASVGAYLLVPAVLDSPQLGKRKYAHLLTFYALLSQHVYSRAELSGKSLLRGAFYGFMVWLMMTYLSARVGGRTLPSGKHKNHTQTLYFKGLASTMPAFQRLSSRPWPDFSEEQGEQSFAGYKRYSSIVQRQTDLLGERADFFRRKLLKDVESLGAPQEPLWPSFKIVQHGSVVLHKSLFQWQTPIVGHTEDAGERKLAAVNFNLFLLQLRDRVDEQKYVSRRDDGAWVIRLGSDASTVENAAGTLELCFAEPEVPPRTPCKCKISGKCTGKSCSCFVANQPCLPACHGGRVCSACKRPAPVHDRTTCTGECGDGEPTGSLTYIEWLAEFDARPLPTSEYGPWSGLYSPRTPIDYFTRRLRLTRTHTHTHTHTQKKPLVCLLVTPWNWSSAKLVGM
jgi:hypothetical protein